MAIKVIRAVTVECDDCGYTYDELDVTPIGGEADGALRRH